MFPVVLHIVLQELLHPSRFVVFPVVLRVVLRVVLHVVLHVVLQELLKEISLIYYRFIFLSVNFCPGISKACHTRSNLLNISD